MFSVLFFFRVLIPLTYFSNPHGPTLASVIFVKVDSEEWLISIYKSPGKPLTPHTTSRAVSFHVHSTLERKAKKKKKNQEHSAIHDEFEAAMGYRICIGFEDCRHFIFLFFRKIISLFLFLFQSILHVVLLIK